MRHWFEQPRRQALLLTLSVLLAFAIGVTVSRWLVPFAPQLSAQSDTGTVGAPPRGALQIAEQLQEAFAWVARKVEPSTVTIMTPRPLFPRPTFRFPPFPEPDPFEEFFRRFFERGIPNPPEEAPSPSLRPRGAGVIVSPEGYILTNRHVIEGVSRIVVALWNDRRFEAKVVGTDDVTDLAVLKIEPGDVKLVAATLGDSDKVKVGDWAIAIGNPFGLRQTITVGIISAIGRRPFETGATIAYTEFLQTDAAINPGNSGGPLCNIRGEVIGINTAIQSITGGNMGIGFAIPSNTAKFVLEQIIKRGKVVRGWLGVELQEVSDLDDPSALGLKEPRGAVIVNVLPNSPAEKAGLKPQDVIVEFNGVPIRNIPHLQSLVGRTAPGTTVPIKIVRGGKEMTIQVQIGERTPEVVAAAEQAREIVEWRGITVGELTSDIRQQLNVPANIRGVVVMWVTRNSPGARAGIRQGDIITVIANQEVASVSDFSRIVRTIPPNRSAPVTLWREGSVRMVVVQSER